MRRRPSGLRMVINRPPCDEDFESAISRSVFIFQFPMRTKGAQKKVICRASS
jgi:hypothetical protein